MGERRRMVCESIFEVCYAGNNSGEGFGLARSLGWLNIVDPRSCQAGWIRRKGYGTEHDADAYNMFKEGYIRA